MAVTARLFESTFVTGVALPVDGGMLAWAPVRRFVVKVVGQGRRPQRPTGRPGRPAREEETT
jgi:hypothetical protein